MRGSVYFRAALSMRDPKVDRLRLTERKARFEIRNEPDDRPAKHLAGKLRSELSGSLPGIRERLPDGVALWGALSFIHRRWADPAGMATRTGGAHCQIHSGNFFGGFPALDFRRNKRGEFRVKARGELDPNSRARHVDDLSFDHAHDLVYRLVLHPSDGALTVWIDGRRIIDVRGQSIDACDAKSYWALGYYAGGASCPIVVEFADHRYPARLDLADRLGKRPAWPRLRERSGPSSVAFIITPRARHAGPSRRAGARGTVGLPRP